MHEPRTAHRTSPSAIARPALAAPLSCVATLAFAGAMLATAVAPTRAQEASSVPLASVRTPGMVAPGEPVDVELESALSGRPVRLSSMRSRVLVLFYEDREHIPQNEELKGNLQRFIADNHLEAQLAMVPIANADGYASFGGLVRGGLGEAARRIGLDILIDWDRRMYAAPFSMRPSASNVVVLDRQGRITFRHAGLVGSEERSSLFRAVRQALRAR